MQDAPVESMAMRQEMHKQFIKEVENFRGEKLKEYDNKDALADEALSWGKRKNIYDYNVWSELSNNLDGYERRNAEGIIRNQIKNGNPEQAKKDAEYFVSKMLFSPEQANNIIQHQTLDTEAMNQLSEGKDFEEIRSYIMIQPIDTNIKKQLISDIGFEASQQQDRLEALIEQEETEIESRISKGQKAGNLIDLSHMSADDKHKWRQREYAESDRRAKGLEIETSQFVKGRLETMAYQVEDKGNVQKFRNELYKAYYDEEKIDRSAYDELYSLSERKFDAHRDAEVSERMKLATSQLLSVPSKESASWTDWVKTLTKEQINEKDELRKLESDNLDRYRRALRNWLETDEGAKANADDIYKYGRRLLFTTFKKTPEQLRAGIEVKPEPVKKKSRLDIIPQPGKWENFESTLRMMTKPEQQQEYYDKWKHLWPDRYK
jgi:hypothetical protein